MKLEPDNIIFCDGSSRNNSEYCGIIILTSDGQWIEHSANRSKINNHQLHEYFAIETAVEFHNQLLNGFSVIYTDCNELPRVIYGKNKFKNAKFFNHQEIASNPSIKVRSIAKAPCVLPYYVSHKVALLNKSTTNIYEGFPPSFSPKKYCNPKAFQPTRRFAKKPSVIRWRSFENYFEFYKHCQA